MFLYILSATQNIMRLLLLLNLCDAWIGVVSSLVSRTAKCIGMCSVAASVSIIISESLANMTTYLAQIIPPSPPTYLHTEKHRLVECREFDPAGSRSHGPLGPVATSHGVTQLLLH